MYSNCGGPQVCFIELLKLNNAESKYMIYIKLFISLFYLNEIISIVGFIVLTENKKSFSLASNC